MNSSASSSSSTPRLLVTGATGFIGSRLALYAHRQGMDVLATGRAESALELSRAAELRAAAVPLMCGLLQDHELLRTLVRDRTAVIHLAAAQHETQVTEAYFHETNVTGTLNLLRACQGSSVRRFVYSSSIGVYGQGSDAPLNEDSALRPDNMYTRSKAAAEVVIREHAHRLETCIIRIGEAYGPDDHRLLKLFRTVARGRFVMIGNGLNRRQCIHVQDVIHGLLLAAQHPAAVGETFLMVGPEAFTTRYMVARIADAVERDVSERSIPMWPFMSAARVMEAVLPRFNIPAPLNTRRLDFFRKSLTFSTSKARDALGFAAQIDFRDGAVDTAQWYRLHGHLPPQPMTAARRPSSA